MLGVTPQHIYKMAKAGLIPCFHVKGAVRFCPAELAAWIKQEIEQANRKRKRVERRDKYQVRDLRFNRLLQFGAKAAWHCQPVLLNNWALASGITDHLGVWLR
jgi:hypothetical protein